MLAKVKLGNLCDSIARAAASQGEGNEKTAGNASAVNNGRGQACRKTRAAQVL